MENLVVPAHTSQLDAVLAFIGGKLTAHACPDAEKSIILMAAEEVFVNIAQYAYQHNEGEVFIQCEITREPKSISLVFCDNGLPYNPLEAEDPDITLSAEEREVGGLGIFLVKQSMNHVDYTYSDGQNRLTLTKAIGAEAADQA